MSESLFDAWYQDWCGVFANETQARAVFDAARESGPEFERLEEGNYTLITALKILLRRSGDRLEYSQEELFDAAEDGRGIYFGPEGITLEEVPE